MKLRVLDIPEEGIDLSAKAADDRWFGDLVQDAFQADFHKGHTASLKIHLLRTCDNVQVTGTATVDLNPACSRCLESFEKRLTVPVQVSLAPYQAMPVEEGEEIELVPEDLEFSFYKGEEINLAEILREVLVLEIPLRYLCAESCKGLCPHCGKNLNTGSCSCAPTRGDPRFAVLGKLRKLQS